MRLKGLPTAEAKEKFFDLFFTEYSKVSFGSTTKRDLECLILHCLREAGLVDDSSNRALANALGINETRLKAYLVDVRYKYRADDMAENVRKLIDELFAREGGKVSYEDGKYAFAIEDPVVKLDFEQAMKEVGYFADGSFNREIVRVKDYALIAFLFRWNRSDNTYEEFKTLLKKNRASERELLEILSQPKPWLERGKEIINTLGSVYDKVLLLRKLAVLALTGTFS
jgi:hypothetical protein